MRIKWSTLKKWLLPIAFDHLVDEILESLGVDVNCVLLEYLEQILLIIFKDEVKSPLSTQN